MNAVIRPSQSSVDLRDTIAYEGTHVRDAQAFVTTATMEGQYDLSRNRMRIAVPGQDLAEAQRAGVSEAISDTLR